MVQTSIRNKNFQEPEKLTDIRVTNALSILKDNTSPTTPKWMHCTKKN